MFAAASGRSSEVERQLPKLNVAGSIPAGRSKTRRPASRFIYLETSMKIVPIVIGALIAFAAADPAFAVSNTTRGAVGGAVGGAVVAGPVGAVVGGVGGAVLGRHYRGGSRHHWRAHRRHH